MRRFSASLVILVMITLLVGTVSMAAAAATGGSGYYVLGYYPVDWPGDRVAYNGLLQAERVDAVAAFLYAIDAQGRISGQEDPQLMALAKQRGIPVYALIHNFVGGNFDRSIAGQVLTDPTVRTRALDGLTRLVREKGYQGIHIDLENVDPAHRAQLTEFVRLLAGRLRPDGYAIGMAVPAKTKDEPFHGWSGAFDYPALGRIVDHIAIMTYDENWIGQGPGPVASIGWVTDVVRYAVTVMPREKILLGIAGYGYDWPAAGGWGQMVPARDAPALARRVGATIQWDSVNQVPYFRYTSGGQARAVYWENAQSTAFKLKLVTDYRLGGIALWRLGHEDPAIWPLINERLGTMGKPPAPSPEPPAEPVPAPVPPAPPAKYGGKEAGWPAPQPAGEAAGTRVHTVAPGETLFLIGLRYGISADAIARANNLAAPDWIMPGQRLVIPTGAAAAPSGQVVHTVQPGETLWLIAQRYGTTWQGIAAANQLASPEWLFPGQKLVIPGATAGVSTRVHTVRSGETLWLIAQRYGTTWSDLAAMNGLRYPHWLMPGQQLLVPDAAGSVVAGISEEIYTVRVGDTLWLIARRYGTDSTSLRAFNRLSNPSQLVPGQRLAIPVRPPTGS